jgi:BTB/POZ domain
MGDASFSSPLPEPLVKHADLWFCDGSVILQADSTLFRVHKSQLSRRSVIFSDMFTLPQPVTTTHATLADETYEGCPNVKLHDSAEDVANLLLALYDGPCVLVASVCRA